MTSLEDFLKRNFRVGSIRFNAEAHCNPEGMVKLRIMATKLGVEDELECIVINNNLKVIEND